MLAAGIGWRFGRRDAPDATFAFVFAAAWIGSEWLRSVLFTGYAWDPIGVIWLPVIGVARLSAWIGTYALSGVTMLFAVSLLALMQRRWRLPAALAGAMALAAVSALWTHAPAATPDAPLLRVVQPNIGQDARGRDDQAIMLAALTRWSGRPGPRPRLVLWPEGVITDYLESGYPRWIYDGQSPLFNRWRLAQLLGDRDVLMTGHTPLRFDAAGDVVGASNSVFALDAQARIVGRYDKAHLVPYGEYLPMPWLLKPLGLARLVPGDIDFDPGPGPRTLAIPGFGAIGVQTCYEIIFSGQVVDPAQPAAYALQPVDRRLVRPLGAAAAPRPGTDARHRGGAADRASDADGISAVIAADGTLLATVPHETAGAIEMAMPPALPPTLFSRPRQLGGADRRDRLRRGRDCHPPRRAIGAAYKGIFISL
ncbi:MAG: apolipoprotein N-acyltransferase [Sphingomonas taxi]